MNAVGAAMPPLLIYVEERVQPTWIADPGPPGSLYAANESSMMQGLCFLKFIKVFHKYIVGSGQGDGKPHVMVFDGHTSHVTIEMLRFARPNNIALFKLPSHSSHLTQLLDIWVFGIFKRKITDILGHF